MNAPNYFLFFADAKRLIPFASALQMLAKIPFKNDTIANTSRIFAYSPRPPTTRLPAMLRKSISRIHIHKGRANPPFISANVLYPGMRFTLLSYYW